MALIDESGFLIDPVRFFNNPELLRGEMVELLPPKAEIVTDLNVAMTLEIRKSRRNNIRFARMPFQERSPGSTHPQLVAKAVP